MNIILLGPPGSGKGTQAELLQKHFQIPSISTGHILRQAVQDKTPIGREVSEIMASGNLVSDELIIAVVKERLAQPDCQSGCILDGFPRTVEQAKALEKSGVPIHYVLDFRVPEDVLVQRLGARWIHLSSGRIYHQAGVDTQTGENLVQRDDDKPEAIIKRLAVYHEQTEPVGRYYQTIGSDLLYIALNADQASEIVCKEILSVLIK